MPSSPSRYPTGCCMNAFATMMKYPESHEPRASATAAARCLFGPSRFSPKRNSPRNVDSRKNAKTPSIARAWPTTSPEKRENRDQLVPNWNSIGMPVTTPMAKLRAKIRPQNRATSLYDSSRRRRASALSATMNTARPIVSCGNR